MARLVIGLAAFLIGSIPFSYIISECFGHVDIRQYGSGNVGATNVVRNLGMKVGLLAFGFDCLKGVSACWLGQTLVDPAFAALCGALAVLGHCYSPWLKFSGGKGVSTTAGVLVFLLPTWLPILAVIFVGVALSTRYISLASIAAAAALPFLAVFTHQPEYLVGFSLFLSVFVIWRHKKNIHKLRQGQESKIRRRSLRS
jgi:glycerol-3-phosphate acyltransferase PlsY